MGTEKINGKLIIKDLNTGKCFEFDELKPIDPETLTQEPNAELEQSVPDGINIHITGSDINKIGSIDIYFKDFEEEK